MTTFEPRTMKQVAVIATPFGFGPASKALAIGRALTEDHGIDVTHYGSGSARTFFDRQDGIVTLPLTRDALICDPNALDSYDAVVNVLAPELIVSPALAARTYYVDSLGFMWQPADFAPGSPLRQVRRYLAQDLFDSVENLMLLGIPNILGVSGIISRAPFPPSGGRNRTGSGRILVHLGGLSNPAGNGSAHAYLPLAERLLQAFGDAARHATVAMNRHRGVFDVAIGSSSDQLSAEQFRAALADADTLVSSPGLTTLVEASHAECPYVPLPPQNWSQVVICEYMSRRSTSELWSFLLEPYRGIDVRLSEDSKAAAVQEVNSKLVTDTAFVGGYGRLVQEALDRAEPPNVGAPFRGASEIAQLVAEELDVPGLVDSARTAVGAR